MAEESTANIDAQNRRIAQEAQTDTDLEAVVPPTWRTNSWWRVGAAAVGVLIIAFAIVQAL